MKRKIIEIDKDKCNGCGICVDACHEGAIAMVDGKAALMRDDYCDGLGDCLPTCPTGAIHFIERDALAYDEAAVKANMEKKKATEDLPCGCSGTHIKTFERTASAQEAIIKPSLSALAQWPVQIQLVPVNAPYFENANLLIAADCSAYAYGNFHEQFMKNRITIVGCPKLDHVDYAEKLTEIIRNNTIRSVTIVRMQVPCCGGLQHAAETALKNSGKFIPWNVVTISTDGRIVE